MQKSSNKYVIKKDSFLNFIENPFYCTLEKYRVLS